MHFLVIDNRFSVPIFVFLERDPSDTDGCAGLSGRWVTLEPIPPPDPATRSLRGGFTTTLAIGGDPQEPNRFAEFASDRHVQAAGFALIEPRYVGPSWETYVSVFHPEGGKRNGPSANRARVRF
jgi:hypothetical protein